MKQKIIQELDNIEKKHAVRIISASESGSRAWGFPSNDSDYDVRFIYVNKPDWYLTIGNKRDVIELPVDRPFKDNVNELIDIKKRHSEKYRLERSEFLDSYINNKIATLQERIPKNPPGPGLDLFDDVFRKTITELDS